MARLVEMSDLWSRRHNVAYLPGFTEYLTLSFGTVFQPRSESESRFLRAATRFHAGRISAAVLGFLGFIVMSVVAWSQWTEARNARRGQLNESVARLLDCQPADLSERVAALEPYGTQALAELTAYQNSEDADLNLRSNLFTQFISGKTFAEIGPKLDQAPSSWFDLVLDVATKTPDAIDVLESIAPQPITAETDGGWSCRSDSTG